jgi:hypothetical protein
MKYKYCATKIEDIKAFEQALIDIGGRFICRPISENMLWQCWFEIGGPLSGETLLFFKLKGELEGFMPIETNL